MGLFSAVTTTEPRPGTGDDRDDLRQRDQILYVKSFLLMRIFIGAIGVLLPTVLILGNFALEHGFSVRGSLSSYYHSGMRDIFVSSLCAIGVFLVAYKIAERNLDNSATVIAGISAIGVALFPTNRIKNINGEPIGDLTPLQNALGEGTTAFIHFSCALISMLALALVSVCFGIREAERRSHRPVRIRWDILHFACAGVIILALAMVGISKLTGILDEHSVLVGEAITLYAFGVSWFFKGFEIPVLAMPASPATAGPAVSKG